MIFGQKNFLPFHARVSSIELQYPHIDIAKIQTLHIKYDILSVFLYFAT